MWPPVKDRLAAVAGRSNPANFAVRLVGPHIG
jgi:hypothetical protein